MTTILAGDLGGTKTKLALFTKEHGILHPLSESTFPSGQFDSLASLVKTYLQSVCTPIHQACFGVAGPVVNGTCHVTNLPWQLCETDLSKSLDFSQVVLVNDLAAIAHALPSLSPADLFAINPGIAKPMAPMAVIAPGTGLGEAFLTWDGYRYHAHASEGGHVEFGPRNRFECDLLNYMFTRYDHVSYELLCSGVGIPNIVGFLQSIDYGHLPAPIAQGLQNQQDITPLVIRSALDAEPNELCAKALEMFVSILGAEAGNLALKVMALGGIYLGGGLSRAIQTALAHPRFMQAFLDKGRLGKVLAHVPVHVILSDNVGLCGAASYGFGYFDF